MKEVDMSFITQNIAPLGVKQIAIFNNDGEKILSMPLGNLSPKSLGNKLYSFGALADVHLPYETASEDFQVALSYFNEVEKVDFICISGDVTDTGTDAEWLNYKNHVDTYSPNTIVHLATGNHDAIEVLSYDYPMTYTGNPLYYSFTQGDDVFIMFGMRNWGSTPFSNESLQWLYETLETNRNKRCFVFQHMMRLDGCGDAHDRYSWDGLANTNGSVFISLMEHYKNVIWFHGHSHTKFELQNILPSPIANYDRMFGCHSVHVPSLAVPRNESHANIYAESEGYVVDVYENGIHLRGRDFVDEIFLPIASYWIDTTLVQIETETYVDNKGVIVTKPSNQSEIIIPENAELFLNKRYSFSGGGLVEDTITPQMFTIIVPVENSVDYVLSIKDSPMSLTSASGSTLYGLKSDKSPNAKINGSIIPSMASGITFSNGNKNAVISFNSLTSSYISLTLRVREDEDTPIAEDDLRGIVITLEEI